MVLKLIIGLGNAPRRYAATYHNVGFLAIDWLEKHRVRETLPSRPHAAKTKGFMNTSGRSVKTLMAALGIRPEELLVIHDDSDLPLGGYTFSFGRGAAGHRGVLSVIAELGTNRFWRLRMGIRSPYPEERKGFRAKAESFVLRPISRSDRARLEAAFAEAFMALPKLLGA